MILDGAYTATESLTISYRLDLRIDRDELSRVSGDVYSSSGTLPEEFSQLLTKRWYSFKASGTDRTNESISRDNIEVELSRQDDWPYNRLLIIDEGSGTIFVRFIDSDQLEDDLLFLAKRQNWHPELPCFRQIILEVDHVEGTEPPQSYLFNERKLSVESVFAEAGINIRYNARNAGEFILPDQADQAWTAAELRAALASSNSALRSDALSRSRPDWYMYLLIASRFQENGTINSLVNGYMFDDYRRGAAVFYTSLKENSNGNREHFLRSYLRTTIHEIGHIFHLKHDTEHSELNFMHLLPSSSEQNHFWNQFNFTFHSSQLDWIRHGLLSQVVMGASEFGSTAMTDKTDKFDAEELSIYPFFHEGLECLLRFKPARPGRSNIFRFGEPVRVELKLRSHYPDSRYIYRDLNPESHNTAFYIQTPQGDVRRYSPLGLTEALDRPLFELHPERPSTWLDIDLTYGVRGFTFLEPGPYEIVAVYNDRSIPIRSKPLKLWISYPQPGEEEAIVPYLESDIGECLALGGSPSAAGKIEEFENDKLPKGHSLGDFLIEANTLMHWFGFKVFDKKQCKIKHEVEQCDQSTRPYLERLLKLTGDYERLSPPCCLGNIAITRAGWRLAQCLRKEGGNESRVKEKKLIDKLKLRARQQNMDAATRKIFEEQLSSDDAPPNL